MYKYINVFVVDQKNIKLKLVVIPIFKKIRKELYKRRNSIFSLIRNFLKIAVDNGYDRYIE